MFGLSWLKRILGGAVRTPAAPERRKVMASIDVAKTTPENRRHWANADHLSADAAYSPGVRRVLRSRARYEAINNSYCAGMLRTLAEDTIGTGPGLQLNTAAEDDVEGKADDLVEQRFADWARAVGLAKKLRTARSTMARDGEVFIHLGTNLNSPDPVKLDLRLYESDQISDPVAKANDLTDGVVLDEFGNPTAYMVLSAHPGSGAAVLTKATPVPARDMLHLYRADRPGQHRGLPEITQSLPLYAQLRRYTLAVLGAAETAANIAGVIKTQASPNVETDPCEAFESFEFDRNMLMPLPMGWDLSQLRAEQPTTTFEMFERRLLVQIARCLGIPYNVAAGDSSAYNYSSGRLDHKNYFRSLKVMRQYVVDEVLLPIFRRWWQEARLIPGYLPAELAALRTPPKPTWRWNADLSVDPVKEAQAIIMLVEAGLMTEAEAFSILDQDWRDATRLKAKINKFKAKLGLPTTAAAPSPKPATQEPDDAADPSQGPLSAAGKGRRGGPGQDPSGGRGRGREAVAAYLRNGRVHRRPDGHQRLGTAGGGGHRRPRSAAAAGA